MQPFDLQERTAPYLKDVINIYLQLHKMTIVQESDILSLSVKQELLCVCTLGVLISFLQRGHMAFMNLKMPK